MVPAPQPLRFGPLSGGTNSQAFPTPPGVALGERVLPVLAYLPSETWDEALLHGVGWCWWCGDSVTLSVLLSRPSTLLLRTEARAIGHEPDQETPP